MKPRTVLVVYSLLLCHLAAAEPEYARVSFQGRLTNPSGATVPDGAYDMLFKFYNAATNGTLLLTDRQFGPTNAVAVSRGLYTALLGGGEIIAGSESNLWSVFLNHPQVYLGVSVASDAELAPRLLLTRAPYAVRAEDALTLSGRPAAQFLNATATSQTKTGQLVLVGNVPSGAMLEVTNISSSGFGIRSAVTSSSPAILALNQGHGSVIQGRSRPATVVFNVATNGDTTISGNYRFNAPRTGRVTLGPADFLPRHHTEEVFILWGYPFKTNRHYLICTRESGFATFHADVHVPEGATLTKLISYIYDIDPGRTSIVNLARCSLFGHLGPDPVYLASNNSVDSQTRVETPFTEVVNTTTNHYVLTLQLYWSDQGMQFFGAQVEYTYTDLKN
jgi:hypothetical protein